METIYKIQQLDGEIIQLKNKINNSPEQSKLKEMNQLMKDGREFISKTNNYASALLSDLKKVQSRYEALSKKVDNISDENLEIDNINESIDDAVALSAEMTRLEIDLKRINDKINATLQDYGSTINKVKKIKENINLLKQIIEKKSAEYQPQILALQKKIDELSPLVDSQILSKYKKMRDDNIFPVYVKLMDNRCGGCRMELSLNFISQLKNKKIAQCEECRRYIIVD